MDHETLNGRDGNAVPTAIVVPRLQTFGSIDSTTGTEAQPISPQINTNRERTDTVWGVIFACCFTAWLIIGFAILGSHNTGIMTGGMAACTARFPSVLTSNPTMSCICAGKTQDVCAYAPAMPADCVHGRRMFTHHRRLDSEDTNWDIFAIFAHFPGFPVVLVLMTAAIAVVWVWALKRWSRPLIHATALLKPAVFILCGITFLRDGADGAVVAIFFIVAAIFIFLYLKYRAKYDLSARVMTASCECLGESRGVWRVASGLQACYLVLLGFYTWVACQTYNVSAWEKEETGQCWLEPAGWAISGQRFMAAMYVWVLFFFNGARLLAVSTSAVSWFFHSDDPTKMASPALQGAKWAFTSSFGTISFGSLLVTLAHQVKASAQSKVAWCSPIGCALKLVFHYMHSCFAALTKFCLIVHVFTAEPFCKSVSSTYNLIKRRFASAIIVDMAAEDCLRPVQVLRNT